MLHQSKASESLIDTNLKRFRQVRTFSLSPTARPDQLVLCQQIPCSRLLQQHRRLGLLAACRKRDGRSQNQRSAQPRERPQLLTEQFDAQY